MKLASFPRPNAHWLLLVTWAVWTTATSAAPTTAPATSQHHLPTTRSLQLLDNAIRLQLRGDYEEALTQYHEALDADPTLKSVHFQLGVLGYQLNKPETARSELKQSIDLNEQVPEALNLLGVLDAQDHQYEQAIAQFEAASKLAPGDPQSFYNWSESLRDQGKAREAIPLLRKAIQRKPQDPLYAFKLRMAKIEIGDDQQIVDDLPSQLKLDPPSGDWIMTAAAVQLRRGKIESAAKYLRAAHDHMEPLLFFAMLQDELFQVYRSRPEIAPFYAVDIHRTSTMRSSTTRSSVDQNNVPSVSSSAPVEPTSAGAK